MKIFISNIIVHTTMRVTMFDLLCNKKRKWYNIFLINLNRIPISLHGEVYDVHVTCRHGCDIHSKIAGKLPVA